MENESVINYTYTYIFKEDFNSVWDTLKDFRKTNRLCNLVIENFATPPVFNKGSYTYELESEFEFIFRNIFHVNVTNIEVEEKYNSAKIKYYIKTNSDLLPNYIYMYSIFGDSKLTNITVIVDIVYDHAIKQTKEQREVLDYEFFIIMKNIENCIKEERKSKIHTGMIEVSKNHLEVWENLIQFKKFLKLVPLICEEVSFEGDYLDSGLEIIFKSKNKSRVYMKVMNMIKELDYCSLTFESYKSIPPVPKQIIEWKIINLDENRCIVKLIHQYNEIIRKESLEFTTNIKKKILEQLKYKIEEL